jgi:hypothetical protein
VGEAPAGGSVELFGAWRTFFERLAAIGIVALLFEDLQYWGTRPLLAALNAAAAEPEPIA